VYRDHDHTVGLPRPAVNTSATPITHHALRALLDPQSIAVVGASSDRGKAGGRPLWYLQEMGYAGPIYPINPHRRELGSLPCYPSLNAVPGPIDLCIVAVPAEQVEGTILDCAARGVPAAVVFASGFAEIGPDGQQRQARIREVALAYGMALCGPNCLGLLNVRSGAAATFTTALERCIEVPIGNVGFVSQSGAIAAFILALAQDQGVGLCSFVTTGNEAVLRFEDYIRYLVDDENTQVIIGYVEGVDGAAFVDVARLARARHKPLVVMKVGASVAGAGTAATHTGKLAGADAVYNAVFRQLGVVRARSVEDLLDFGRTLSEARLPQGGRVGIVSISGGAAVLMADWCELSSLEVPPLTPDTRTQLQSVLPWFATAANPLDTTGRPLWEEGMLRDCLTIMAQAPEVDMILLHVGLAPGPGRRIAEEILAAAGASDKPLLVCWLPESDPIPHAMLREAGVPIYVDPTRLVRSAAVLAWYAATSAAPTSSHRTFIEPFSEDMTDFQAREWLTRVGITMPREAVTTVSNEAVAQAETIGFPVCLKIVSPDVLHRSELGAVRVGLNSTGEVAGAFDEILTNVETSVPDARVEGILVQEMVVNGTELMVSTFRDETFGPVVVCAMGGIAVEVLQDRVIRLAPVSSTEARAMLSELRGAPLLFGVRGGAPRDVEAAADAISLLSTVLPASEALDAVEINPLIVLEEGRGVRAVDTVIRRRAEEPMHA